MSNEPSRLPGLTGGAGAPATVPGLPGFIAATRRKLMLGTLFINLVVFLLLGLATSFDYIEHAEQAEVASSNLAKALENEIAGTILVQDLALHALVDEYKHQLSLVKVDRKAVDEWIHGTLSRLPGADAMRISDAEGNLIYGSEVTAETRVNVADRPHFIRLRDNPGLDLVFSKPQISRINKKWVMVLARRIDLPDGRFGGIASLAVDLSHLSKTFSTLEVGQRGLVVLRDSDLAIVAGYPEIEPGAPGGVGSQEAAPELRRQIQSGQRHGVLLGVYPVDGVERKLAFRQVHGYPFFIVVGLATEEYMKDWYRELVKDIALVSGIALLTGVAAWSIYRIWRRQIQGMELLAVQEAKFRTVADYTQDWEYWQGPDGAIRYMTPSCLEVTGYSRDEFSADPDLLRRVVHPDDRPQFDAALVGEVTQRQLDFRIVRRDGEVRWMAHRCIHIVGSDGICQGRRVANRDITERKLGEAHLAEALMAAEAGSRAKTTFLANMGHELRTPLNGIMGMTSLALRQATEPRQIDQLNKAMKSSRRLLDIINDVLDIAKIEAERLTLEHTPFRISQVLHQLMDQIADKARDKGLQIQVSLPPGLSVRLFRGDALRLGQVLVNLAGNAVKFTVSGSVSLRTSVVAEDAAGVLLRWEVQDTGIGIRAEELPRLFSAFEQADNSMTRGYGGTGLGLVISKRLVQMMGGEIGVDSVPEQGSTFWFTVRLETVAGSDPVDAPAPVPALTQ